MADKNQFARLCRDEAEQVSRLIAFLEEEQSALVCGAIQSLEPLADAKNQALEALAHLANERLQWLHAEGMHKREQVLRWIADTPAACDAWVELEAALQKALVLNEFNGQQINKGLESTEQALSVLKTAAASMMSYARDGTQAELSIGGRHLGSA